jgi:hypothetical protein
MPASDTARLTVTFSREADLAMRAYSGAQGMRKGDLSRFIEDAVRWRMFDSAVQAVKVRNADIPPEDLYTAWSAPLPTRERGWGEGETPTPRRSPPSPPAPPPPGGRGESPALRAPWFRGASRWRQRRYRDLSPNPLPRGDRD